MGDVFRNEDAFQYIFSRFRPYLFHDSKFSKTRFYCLFCAIFQLSFGFFANFATLLLAELGLFHSLGLLRCSVWFYISKFAVLEWQMNLEEEAHQQKVLYSCDNAYIICNWVYLICSFFIFKRKKQLISLLQTKMWVLLWGICFVVFVCCSSNRY